jgi:signal transduction histidine kinase
MPAEIDSDIEMLSRIAVVPTILEVVCRTTGMGFATVARVTTESWVACDVRDEIEFGLKPGGALPIKTTICHEIHEHRGIVVINHVAADPRYCNHHTPALYGFQSYISTPIVLPDGTFFGTLCAIDPHPHTLDTPEILGMFKLFAELLAFHIDSHLRLAESRAEISSEREVSKLREQFIAVLGHDLRNPLASIDAGARLLQHQALDKRGENILGMMQQSVARMSRLIDDVLDFARGRLGGGFVISADTAPPLRPALEQVIDELRSKAPDRNIVSTCQDIDDVHCDSARIAQLLSNLLGNALTHGAPDTPIHVNGAIQNGFFILSVTNNGTRIEDDIRENLFQPFVRGEIRPNQQGLGLGLFIAAEIARAHNGTLDVTSDDAETCFTFRMPLAEQTKEAGLF